MSNKTDRQRKLLDFLLSVRVLQTPQDLAIKMEVDERTIKRDIFDLRIVGADIKYHRNIPQPGYELTNKEHIQQYPNLWLDKQELSSLLISHHLLKHQSPPIIVDKIKPLQDKIAAICQKEFHILEFLLENRFQVLSFATRAHSKKILSAICLAILQKNRLLVTHYSRGKNTTSKRDISVQRLSRYQENWYVDAYVHDIKQIRTFSLDCITKTSIIKLDIKQKSTTAYKTIRKEELDAKFLTSFGIFAGLQDKTAILEFSEFTSRWVKDETWHTCQKDKIKNKKLTREIPYKNDRELIMQILKYGENIKVIAPQELQNKIKNKLQQTLKQYK
ncbi:MAG: hypothetical protein DRQ51_06740 [Gammaproteobacteria bacterium]|nr:MAG: hypothetical protein DRQ51_06740 [Gammaproteobacteria bacterium]